MSQPQERQMRAEELLQKFWSEVERGGRPSVQALLDAYPDLADLLEPKLAAYRDLQADVSTVSDSAVLGRVRYFGDYELREVIAHGGMGVVYRARQVSLDRDVALKMILAGELASDDAVQRFRNEARAVARLQHPNIVQVHEVGEYAGQHYFTMDCIEGGDLAQRVERKPLPSADAARYAKTIAEAIQCAHEHGILHRDLKPSNVLLDAADEVKVTDFGLAKLVEGAAGLTASDQVLGTPSFMSPEQATGRHDQVGPRSDVYSIGAILYQLLTARPPFEGENALDTLALVRDALPLEPRKVNSTMPRDLETICMKCLEKSPEHRYASAQQLADDLGRFLREQPVEARRAGIMRRIALWTQQHPWIVAAVAAGMIIALLTLSYGLWAQNRYLRWTIEHPDHVRRPGVRMNRGAYVSSVSTLLWAFASACRGQLWRRGRIHQPAYILKRRGALPVRRVVQLGVLGAFVLLFSIAALPVYIEAYVWEGETGVWTAWLWFSFWVPIELTWGAVREYRAAVYGVYPPKKVKPRRRRRR